MPDTPPAPVYSVPAGLEQDDQVASPIPISIVVPQRDPLTGAVVHVPVDQIAGLEGAPTRVWIPPSRRSAAVIEPGAKGDVAAALTAGKVCSSCRYYDHGEGQRRFTRERLGEALTRELAWKPEWWDPSDYGACGLLHRYAVHKDAPDCGQWAPKSRAVSFWRKMTGR